MSSPPDTERLCLHTITTRPWPLETAIEKYAAAGVSGISLWKEALAGREPAAVARHLKDAGLVPVSLVRGGFFPASSQQERRAAREENLRLIRLAAELGTPMIVLVCGADPVAGLEVSRRQIADGLAAILPTARELGVRLAIEPLHPMYADTRSAINTMQQANELCDQLNDPGLGVAVDIYHLWWDPDLENQIVRAGKSGRLFAFHTCDWKYPVEDILNDRGLMGEGCAPIRRIRGWCEENGFNGFHEVEIFSNRYWSLDQDQYLAMIIDAYLEYA